MAFSRDIKRFSKKARDNADKITRATIIDLGGAIIRGTPVGNPSLWKNKPSKGYVGGSARGNWFSTLHNHSPTINESRRAGDAVANLLSVAAQAPGEVFYLTNNLPYIRRLEYEHWSTQAKSGMVRINVDRFQTIVKQKANGV